MAKAKYLQKIKPIELEVADNVKLVISASAKDEPDADIHIDIRTWIEGESYTGPTKRGITFHEEWLLDLIEILDNVAKELKL